MTVPPSPAANLIRPFMVVISDAAIADVKQRLARTRRPDPETVAD